MCSTLPVKLHISKKYINLKFDAGSYIKYCQNTSAKLICIFCHVNIKFVM